jgi:hypothetical protein
MIRHWKRLHNKELHELCSSPNNIRITKSRVRWAGHVADVRERRGAYRVLVEKPERKRPLRRLRSRWKDNIKLPLQRIGYDGVHCIDQAQDKHKKRVFWVTQKARNFETSCLTVSFSERTLLYGVQLVA